MTEEAARRLVSAKKRRGVARASITRLANRLKDLEGGPGDAKTLQLAQRMSQKLTELDSEFRAHHHSLIDLIDEDDSLAKEQEILDSHDDLIAELSVRVEQVIAAASPTSQESSRRVASRKLTHIEKSLESVTSVITDIAETPLDTFALRQYEEKTGDMNKELVKSSDQLDHMDLEDDDELFQLQDRLEKQVFDCSVKIKKLLSSPDVSVSSSASIEGKGVKLPKLDVPKFDGNILNWRSFWEQFCIAVHDRAHLSDSEKLVYLQQSLKGGSAKVVIEGLSRSGECYSEAVKCLQTRYNRPRLIHQTHVKMILDAPQLTEGNGKELRRLHDVVQQHLRALKAMDCEPPGPFVTSILELKLDQNTMFEWQKHSQDSAAVPHYNDLLEFINLRAQASETLPARKGSSPSVANQPKRGSKPVTAYAASVSDGPNCVVCQTERHPLYFCQQFKLLSHEQKVKVLKTNGICMNCLKPGHFVRQCKSLHHCKVCQKPHHTLLHLDNHPTQTSSPLPTPKPDSNAQLITSNPAINLSPSALLMTCRVLVQAPDGSMINARALLDSASSASFVSERLVRSLALPRQYKATTISGVAGLMQNCLQSLTNLTISSPHTDSKFNLTAIVVPRVTCDLPVHPVPHDSTWTHLNGIPLADPSFGTPGRIDILLGVDIFTAALLHGRRVGQHGTPTAFETTFGWVLAGPTTQERTKSLVTSHHTLISTGDDLLRQFWEIEEVTSPASNFTPEERSVMQHFDGNHYRTEEGRFVVPLPKRPHSPLLGESRSHAVRRFLALERSLHAKGEFKAFDTVMQEYFELKHAELVPEADLGKPQHDVFYLPMHAVKKESSTTTKLRAVFDTSAKSSTNVSLNDVLMVGPTVHSSLVDVLLRFRLHRIAMTADISKMYRAVELVDSDRDLHRFVWRSSENEALKDYRMTRVTFGVSASSFAANMAVRQNALDHALEFPKAAAVVEQGFYVDDCLTGADTVAEAADIHHQLLDLFAKGGFLLRKWNSSDESLLEQVDPDLRDTQSTYHLPASDQYKKTLGIEWNAHQDHFRLTVVPLKGSDNITKRGLTSDIAKTFDALGWFAPTVIKAKILLQKLWESKIGWDDLLPPAIYEVWLRWRSELPLLSERLIPRCYFPKDFEIDSIQLHGFCDASEDAYAGAVYIRTQDKYGNIHVSLVTSKTKVAPIKQLTIPRPELCGAQLLAKLLHNTKLALKVPMQDVYAWTDSTIVLSWLIGNPRRFKTFVGNRVLSIMQLIPPERWSHVESADNPADCSSRGLFPSELIRHELWWNSPDWLRSLPTQWPRQYVVPAVEATTEERGNACLHIVTYGPTPLIPLDQSSSFLRLKRVTAWVLRFISNCRNRCSHNKSIYLTTDELRNSERYWALFTQEQAFQKEMEILREENLLPPSSRLFTLHPFIDSFGLLRVGGRGRNTDMEPSVVHPIILPGKHPITSLIVSSEHRRLMHAGPTLLTASLNRRYHIIGCRKIVRSITRSCVTCRRTTVKPNPQVLGQLPPERLTPDSVFSRVGVDYAGPFTVKYGPTRKPKLVKTYVCVFVSLTIKAVHLELVSDLTTDAFIATLRRFIARRGKPTLIWSDHGTNFVGAARELKDFIAFFQNQKTQGFLSEFCAAQGITWKFIPERTPHFGGLWEAAVRSMKTHLRRIMGDIKFTFEEFSTVLAQIEACLNSRPLTPIPNEGDVVEALTPGHFLIGRPLEALPDPSASYQSISLLRRWHLCQHVIRHFWKRWSSEYINILCRFTKWHQPSRNLQTGDVVILHEDNLIPTKWPMGRVVKTYPGKDGFVRIVDVKTSNGVYKRPITKIALLLPQGN